MTDDCAATFEIDAKLRRVAHEQLGLVTVGQAALAGVDSWALQRRRDAGALELLFANVMRLVAAPATPEQRILAAALAVPRSMITGTSAAVVHQLPTASTRPMVAVTFSRSARTAGVTVVRHRIDLPSQPWHSVRVATPAATVVMLPRFVDPATLERCIDHCIAHGLTTASRILGLVAALPARSVVGRQLLLDLLEQRSCGVGHRSRMEQRVARWLTAAGLTGWLRNFDAPVGGGETVEVDFGWVDAKVALEVSPFFTHGSRAKQERDMERRRLLVLAGWRVIEATDPDLESHATFAATVVAVRVLLAPAALCALASAEHTPTHTTPRWAG